MPELTRLTVYKDAQSSHHLANQFAVELGSFISQIYKHLLHYYSFESSMNCSHWSTGGGLSKPKSNTEGQLQHGMNIMMPYFAYPPRHAQPSYPGAYLIPMPQSEQDIVTLKRFPFNSFPIFIRDNFSWESGIVKCLQTAMIELRRIMRLQTRLELVLTVTAPPETWCQCCTYAIWITRHFNSALILLSVFFIQLLQELLK